jgi:hypothetical protein
MATAKKTKKQPKAKEPEVSFREYKVWIKALHARVTALEKKAKG